MAKIINAIKSLDSTSALLSGNDVILKFTNYTDAERSRRKILSLMRVLDVDGDVVEGHGNLELNGYTIEFIYDVK
jgi:hypothetical protein